MTTKNTKPVEDEGKAPETPATILNGVEVETSPSKHSQLPDFILPLAKFVIKQTGGSPTDENVDKWIAENKGKEIKISY